MFVTREAKTALQTGLSTPFNNSSVTHTVISSISKLFSKLHFFVSSVIGVNKLHEKKKNIQAGSNGSASNNQLK